MVPDWSKQVATECLQVAWVTWRPPISHTDMCMYTVHCTCTSLQSEGEALQGAEGQRWPARGRGGEGGVGVPPVPKPVHHRGPVPGAGGLVDDVAFHIVCV